MKDKYKKLQKKLKNMFDKPSGNNYYSVSSVGLWFKQCGIKPDADYLQIVCMIHGSVPYPYQEPDRKNILKYLKDNKFKQYKKDFLK